MSSKHHHSAQLIKRELYDDLQSFAQLEQRISALGAENTKIVGDAFEVFVEGYLGTHQKLQADTVWLVGQLPLEVRQQLNLPNDAKGIDGVFRTRTGTLVPYQVKFRSQRAYLTFTEVAPFLGLTERATDRIIFTNSNEVADDAKNRDAMRTVRGIDFDDLTADELRVISCWLRQQPTPIPQPIAYPYQVKALSDIAETLTRYDRAHVVMACGTGKTLVALWAVEQLQPKTVLVLVPSLTLLQQSLDEWSRHNNWGKDFTYLCVCSDPTVASKDEYDPIDLNKMDLEFRVDTDSDEVRRFIERDTSNIKVVFSTYHSSGVVSEGVRGLTPFDVAIFDEAHRTTGPQGGSFAHCLFQENIDIRKRLFFTATPRHYDIRHRNREGDFKIQSMDDPTVYGPRAYTLTFGSAARQDIICNYKVVISVVDGHEVNDFALKYGITLVQGDLIGAKWVANQIAIERAVEKTGAKHIITFHSRVSSAKEFRTDGSRGVKQYLPEFSVFHVNGSQHSSERKQIIRSFRDATKSLITNARCLTEGIDVPAVDMVAFIDPRHSRIDIAQATGRAMRKPRGSDKTFGYIVVPLFLERRGDETVEQALERSDFSDVADVLNALQEQDEDLIDIIRELREAKGHGDVFDPRRLAEKVEVLGPSIELLTLRSNIFSEILDTVGVGWDEWYGRLQSYKDRIGDCRVPAQYKTVDGYRLGQWVSIQRLSRRLSDERKARLNALGFDWSPHDTAWEEGPERFRAFVDEHKHCDVPPQYKSPDGYKLGRWVIRRRFRKDTLTREQKEILDALGFDWDPITTQWEEAFEHLQAYVKTYRNCRVPSKYKSPDGYRLGGWVVEQRHKQEDLSPECKARLNALGFYWDPFTTDWEDGYEHLVAYVKDYKNCRVPHQYKSPDGFGLGSWVSKQRNTPNTLAVERKARLDALGFDWNPLKTQWEEGLERLKAYVKDHGHCHVDLRYKTKDGYPLGSWLGNQRELQEALSAVKKDQLSSLGFIWNVPEALWEKGFDHLTTYKNQYKDCHVAVQYKSPDGYALGRWVSVQRQWKNRLSTERKSRLDALGFDWDPIATQWKKGFQHLQAFVAEHKHSRIPRGYKSPDGYKLGIWIGNQRRTQDKLSNEKKARLDELGFDWKPHETVWDEGFEHFQAFVKEHKHSRVPQGYVSSKGYRLGAWVSNQRLRDNLSTERKARLDALGFVWEILDADWDEGFEHLKLFKQREGHCRVAAKYKENGYPLGRWVSRQRQVKDKLLLKRQQRLDELGFIWDAREVVPLCGTEWRFG